MQIINSYDYKNCNVLQDFVTCSFPTLPRTYPQCPVLLSVSTSVWKVGRRVRYSQAASRGRL